MFWDEEENKSFCFSLAKGCNTWWNTSIVFTLWRERCWPWQKSRGTRRCGAKVSLQTLSHVAACLPPVFLFQGLMDNQPLSPRYTVCGCQQGNKYPDCSHWLCGLSVGYRVISKPQVLLKQWGGKYKTGVIMESDIFLILLSSTHQCLSDYSFLQRALCEQLLGYEWLSWSWEHAHRNKNSWYVWSVGSTTGNVSWQVKTKSLCI